MRRMRQALKRTYSLRKATSTKDSEGSTYPTYATAVPISAIIRHASGRTDAAQYGERLNSILKMQYEGDEDISLGDGICVFVSGEQNPDYTVVAIRGLTEDTFTVYELEAI